jgi:hypothetical protein
LTLSAPPGMICINTYTAQEAPVNIFSNLASVLTGNSADEDAPELTAEQKSAEEKKARIKFHRESVRNGPTKFRHITAGQVRRAEARAKKRQMDRNFKREVKNYFERQRLAAAIRAHLQIVGVIPFFDGREEPLEKQVVSTVWIVQRFGVEVTNDEGIGLGFMSFREQATGAITRVPADFEPAMFEVVADEAVA